VFDNSLCKLTVCARITKCDVRLEEGDSQCGQIIFKEFEKAVEIYSQSSSSFYEVNSVVYIPYFGKRRTKHLCLKGGTITCLHYSYFSPSFYLETACYIAGKRKASSDIYFAGVEAMAWLYLCIP
jgi:hypothetical protein